MIQINGKMYPKRPGFEERLERARRLYPMATEGLLESIANGRWSTG